METGPGAWEKLAFKDKVKEKSYKRTSVSKAFPTLTHMALVELAEKDILKFLIS